MRTETALRVVRDRERLLVGLLEDERSTGMPAPFDWRRWRLRNEMLVARTLQPGTRFTDDERALFAPLVSLVHKAGDKV